MPTNGLLVENVDGGIIAVVLVFAQARPRWIVTVLDALLAHDIHNCTFTVVTP